jgi:two-component system NtrC family sensor kinase
MRRILPSSGMRFSGTMKLSVAVIVLGAVGILASMQWTVYSVHRHVGIASQCIFPAALDSQRAGTAFERMNHDYRDAFVMQDSASLASAGGEAATVMASLDSAGKFMAFNSTRHEQILSLLSRVTSLQARSKIEYAAGAEKDGTPPSQQELANLTQENQSVEAALEALQNDLANDFKAELSLISGLLAVEGMLQVLVFVGVIAALFFGIRSLIKVTVQRREDEILREAHSVQAAERNMLRALIDNMPDFMYVKDLGSRFIVANAHAAHKVGEDSPEKLLGKTDFDFYAREIASAYFEDEQNVMRSGQPLYNREEAILDSAGNKNHILTTKVPLRNSEGKVIGIAGVGRDITARKKMENDLREAEQKYRGIFDNAIMGIFQSLADGRLLSINRSMAANFGYDSPEEMLASVADVSRLYVYPKSRDEFKRLLSEEGSVQNFESELYRKDGSKIWMAISAWTVVQNGVVIRYEGISEDISMRKEMELALREAEQNYRGIFDNAIFGIFQTTPDGRLVNANHAMAVTYGFDSVEEGMASASSGDIAGKAYVNPERRKEFKRLMEENGAVQNFEYEAYRKDGNKIWLSMSARAIRENGVVVRYEGMSEEVTERKVLREQLLQAQKLESVGQLAAGIAHEINTPTQYIGDNVRFLKDAFEDLKSLLTRYDQWFSAAGKNGLSGALLEEAAAAVDKADAGYLLEEIPKAIDQTLEGVSRVAALVSAMKEFSHPDTKEKSPLDLNRAIASTITVARNEWKYVADLETEFDSSLPAVSCHPGEFNQVILNLIVNAAHAIADVARAGGPQRGSIKVQTRSWPEWAEVRIRDSGTGIPEKLRTRIFDPFFTTKEIGKGTGQGLAIARSVIVGKHGGSLDFETEEGKGTTFIIRLPYDGKALPVKAVAA